MAQWLLLPTLALSPRKRCEINLMRWWCVNAKRWPVSSRQRLPSALTSDDSDMGRSLRFLISIWNLYVFFTWIVTALYMLISSDRTWLVLVDQVARTRLVWLPWQRLGVDGIILRYCKIYSMELRRWRHSVNIVLIYKYAMLTGLNGGPRLENGFSKKHVTKRKRVIHWVCIMSI